MDGRKTSGTSDDGSSSRAPAPSLRSLLMMSLLAAITAGVLLVLVVLPAEFGWDPTGIGGALGFTELSATAPELGEAPARSHYRADEEPKQETRVLELGPGDEMELKLVLREGATVLYDWRTDGAAIYSDLHADPFGGFEGEDIRYREDDAVASDRGSITAPFDGNHGWYWRNPTSQAVTITVEVEGFYSVIKEMR